MKVYLVQRCVEDWDSLDVTEDSVWSTKADAVARARNESSEEVDSDVFWWVGELTVDEIHESGSWYRRYKNGRVDEV